MLSAIDSVDVLNSADDAMTSLRHLLRHLSLTRTFFVALGVCVLSLVILAYSVSLRSLSPSQSPPTRVTPDLSCLNHVHQLTNHAEQSTGDVRTDPRILVVVETPYTRLGQAVVIILESVRYKHRMQVISPGRERRILPSLTHGDRGRFAVVVFERLEMYVSLDSWNRQLLDKYCRDFNVGIIAFAQPTELLVSAQVRLVVS